MSVKNFKFVSPGVFINEIDNSFRPRTPAGIGPVVIGRSDKGLGMQPNKLESYSDFVEKYGDTVAGTDGGDVARYAQSQSPMYGTYAAKAFLRSNPTGLNYIRLLGVQSPNNTGADGAVNGWKTTGTVTSTNGGGAYGLWLFASSSDANLGTGSLAAVWYADEGTRILLSGAVAQQGKTTGLAGATASLGAVIPMNSDGEFVVRISSENGTAGEAPGEDYTFNFNDSSDKFVRNVFNTNPTMLSRSVGYVGSSTKNYWLGETFEQEIREGVVAAGSITGSDDGIPTNAFGVILPFTSGSTEGPWNSVDVDDLEAKTNWFIGQDLGTPASYAAHAQQKLFRLKGRGHGAWLNKNCKVSIENIKPSKTLTSKYGSFSVVIRSLKDTDNKVIVLERFDNLNLDPLSTNYIARVIGNQYQEWDNTERRLRTYGDFSNNSKYVYVIMDDDVEMGRTEAELLPFGYWGPPRYKTLNGVDIGTGNPDGYIFSASIPGGFRGDDGDFGAPKSSTWLSSSVQQLTCSFTFPAVRLRHSASDGGLANQSDAYFGMQVTRTRASTRADESVGDVHRRWPGATSDTAVADVAYIFSLDDVRVNVTGAYYEEGSRAAGTSRTATSGTNHLVETDGYDRFTAPFYGGFDGFDITQPDPLANFIMDSSANERNSYVYNTYKRAIDTIADPETLDMNLLVVPGLTNEGLTTHAIDVCEDRADAMAIIDLPDVYTPNHEANLDKNARIGNVQTVVSALRSRQIDSSYGATFYPWVQTVDEPTGQLLWIPPSVAMLGVFGSVERTSQVWFAPAGFNRGGLSDGAAGIPVTSVTDRLTSKNRDTLYEAKINPIASFPSTGIVVFGQKTLQERPSALDRINVRRLVIYLKKQISILSTQVLFEQNVQATWNRFKGLIEPLLANTKVQFGISDYRLFLDESTTTPDLIDQNILYAKIMVKPARAIEYIAIDFVIASTGASFDD